MIELWMDEYKTFVIIERQLLNSFWINIWIHLIDPTLDRHLKHPRAKEVISTWMGNRECEKWLIGSSLFELIINIETWITADIPKSIWEKNLRMEYDYFQVTEWNERFEETEKPHLVIHIMMQTKTDSWNNYKDWLLVQVKFHCQKQPIKKKQSPM